jgi:soluble lytic murein transglycosylase
MIARASTLAFVLGVAACSGHAGHPAAPGAEATPTAPPTIDGGAPATSDAGPTAAAAPARLDLAQAVPTFPDANSRFALEDWTGARALYAAAQAAATDDGLRARAQLMVAICDVRLDHWRDAADGLAAAAPRIPALADWLRYQEARARYFAHQVDRAAELARAVAPDAIAGADAELLVGDIVRAGKDPAATAAHYRGYLTRRPDGPRASEARFRLAEALEQLGPDAAKEMVGAYRQIDLDDPTSSWATKARARLQALASTLPAALATWSTTLTGAEHVARGKVLFDAMRNPESEAEMAAALAAPDLSADDRCVAAYHLAQSQFKARNRTDAAPAFDAAVTACTAVKNADLAVRSAYQAGRSYAYLHQHETAIARYKAAEAAGPTHSLADDARLRQAEEWADLKNDKEVTAALASLPDAYPTGDMRAEAMWRLGWRAFRNDELGKAIGWWQKQIAIMPIDDTYYAEGQAQYWIGRAKAKQGKPAEAIAAWKDAIATYPMSYYALLALNRIREVAPADYTTLTRTLAADPASYAPGGPALTFAPRPEWGTPGFARAMEFLRLGLGEEAEAELRVLKLLPPTDKNRVDDPDQRDKLWAIAFLYDRAGRYATSHWPTRWHILDYKRQWPVGPNRARWEVAFPRAFWPLVTDNAQKNGVPVEMQIAIVREESAFDPLMESYANAIGLTQMIPSTGERFAKGTGIVANRENLRDPAKNVTIGSRFLGFLWARWHGFVTLVPPSYNAGENGVDKMINVRGSWPADEFVEGIVDDQARNYTKRVLTSFFDYTYLYKGEVPVVDNTIPDEFRERARKNKHTH